MRAALVVGNGMNLVDDDGRGGSQHLTRFLGCEENEKRFRSCDENVRGLPEHLRSFRHRRIAGSDGGANRRISKRRPGWLNWRSRRAVFPDFGARRC